MPGRLSVKLKIRLSLWLITLLLLVLVGSFAALWFRREQWARLDDFLLRESQSVKDLMEGYFSFGATETGLLDSVTSADFISFVNQYFQERSNKPLPYKTTLGVFDPQGRAVMVTNIALNLAVPAPDSPETRLVNIGGPQEYRLVFMPLVHRGKLLGTIRIACLTVTLEDSFQSFLFSLVAVLTLAFVSFGSLGTVLIGWSLKPVRQMSVSAGEISDAHLHLRLTVPPGRDELSQMAETLNTLLARLERDFRFEEALVGQLSHELRTPLTVLRARNEIALEGRVSASEARQVMEDNVADVDSVVSLLNTMLDLAKLDGGFDRPPLKAIPLNTVLAEVIEELEPLWEEKDLGLSYTLPQGADSWAACPTLVCRGDRFLLRQVFLNILTNAFKYAPRSSRISLTIEESGTAEVPLWRLVFRNSGPPIPEESLELIFKRFYRIENLEANAVEKASGLGQKGFGLGLSLAKAMLNLQNGRIRAFNPAQGGAAFEIVLHRVPDTRTNKRSSE